MKHEEATSSHAANNDLEFQRAAAVDAQEDLVASLVHVSRDDDHYCQIPPSSTTTPVQTGSTPAQQVQLLQQQQYVVPRVDVQHNFQISQITRSTTLLATRQAVSSTQDSPILENARLTEPFSLDYPPQELGPEGKDLVPFDQSTPSASTVIAPQHCDTALPISQNIPLVLPKSQANFNSGNIDSSQHTREMFFGDMQRNSAAAHRRRSMATTSALTDYEADLTNKDRIKQKDAIRKLLADKVRNDWSWTWPREPQDPGTPIINRSQESLVDDDWVERAESDSNESEIDKDSKHTVEDSQTAVESPDSNDPFRFDSPDGVGDTLRKTSENRKARRRRQLYEEMLVNDGLSCYTHRRNAWTSARHVRRSSGPIITTSTQQQEDSSFPLDFVTEIPIAAPILPPETPMRQSITDHAYRTIYDKVILQSQSPLCPINLSDITKSCVEGWKRDGDWPCKQMGGTDAMIGEAKKVNNGFAAGARRLTEGTGTGSPSRSAKSKGVLRRSLQKVMGAVRERAGSKGKEEDFLTPAVKE